MSEINPEKKSDKNPDKSPEKKQTPTRGGLRSGAGRPRKEKRNAKRQISLPYEMDVQLKKMAEDKNVSYSSLVVNLVKIALES